MLKKSHEFNLYSFLLIITLFTIPLVLTILSYKKNTELNLKFQIYYWGLILLNLIPLIIILSATFNSKEKNKIETKLTPNVKTTKDIIIFLISILVISFSILFAFEVNLNNKIEYLKIIILFFSLIIIIDKIITFNNMDNSNIILENFEYEIYLKNYSDEKIREILQHKYLGFIINDWVQLKFNELTEISQLLDNKIVLSKNDIETLQKTIDILNYPLEFSGRKQMILAEINPKINDQIFEIEKCLYEINNILKDQNKFDHEELLLITSLKEKYSKRISYLKELKL